MSANCLPIAKTGEGSAVLEQRARQDIRVLIVDDHPAIREGLRILLATEKGIKVIGVAKNGLEAIEEVGEPRLEISVKRILDHAQVEIADNGKGIPEDMLEKIFVPFFSTKAGGSGIGLSLSRQIIRNHGGQIAVESRPEKGTTFKITLPAE